MSNLSFARIMYGAAQEQPSYATLSNSSSPLSASSGAAQPASSPAASNQNFLHRAWHALTRHN